ncbi:MAG: GNAT family N-acetyltransferase [Spirulinaceae cyanobacterium]
MLTKHTLHLKPNRALTLRNIESEDEAFLYQVYASTRQEELALVDWDDSQKESFLKMQFNAQHKYYQENYSQAQFLIVLLDEKAIGRLYINYHKDEIRLMDIALLPSFRNQGIGTIFLKKIITEGQQLGLPIRLHVEAYNRALQLYQHLGFQSLGEKGVYYLMERLP